MSVPCSRRDDAVDCKLLAGLVEDVWDRFQNARLIHSNRQRHEAETVWLMQRLQWKEKLQELGESKNSELAGSSSSSY